MRRFGFRKPHLRLFPRVGDTRIYRPRWIAGKDCQRYKRALRITSRIPAFFNYWHSSRAFLFLGLWIRRWLILLDLPLCDDFEPHSSLQLHVLLLGWVKSIQVTFLQSDEYCKPLVSIGEFVTKVITQPGKVGFWTCHKHSDRIFKMISRVSRWLTRGKHR